MLGKESEAVRVEVQLPEANCISACLVRPTWFTYCKCAGTTVLIYRCPPSSQSISGPCRIPLAQSTSPNCLATTAAAEAMLRSSVTSISPAVTGRLPCTSDRANATTDVHNPHASTVLGRSRRMLRSRPPYSSRPRAARRCPG
jgi:hypothetical protein